MATIPRKIRSPLLENDLGYNCYRLSQIIRDESLEQLRRLDPHITPEQWHLILCLALDPAGMTPTQLAESGRRDKTTISRMLDVMERHHLIERVAHGNDSRSYTVRLAAKSRQLYDRARAEGLAPSAERLFAPLNGAEREYLLALLQKCRRAAGDL